MSKKPSEGPNIAIKSRGWYHNDIKWLESLQNLLCFSVLLKLIAGWINLGVVPLSKCEAVILAATVSLSRSHIWISLRLFRCAALFWKKGCFYSLDPFVCFSGKALMPKSEWENQFCWIALLWHVLSPVLKNTHNHLIYELPWSVEMTVTNVCVTFVRNWDLQQSRI